MLSSRPVSPQADCAIAMKQLPMDARARLLHMDVVRAIPRKGVDEALQDFRVALQLDEVLATAALRRR